MELLKWTSFPTNLIHQTLSNLDIPVITESIEGLFSKALHRNVIELNGNLQDLICCNCCYKESIVFHTSTVLPKKCPICSQILRPDIVLLGESIKNFHLASDEIYRADLLLIIGSELKFWPANQLVAKAQKHGCKIIYINL
ncbi:Sir2 family NAD-dependent protein deacetylase [Bacillus toyonensis]|uniref:Sir2 family NAD-dependent protein deacetylase n=1 Tax=Bacillus toyonensis TaxID=155322 RepID=UPI0009B22415|nr:NAD-dependent protein deacetylase [Bacillus toyonensis]